MRYKSKQTFLHPKNNNKKFIYNVTGYIAIIIVSCGALILLAKYIAGVSF